MRDRLFCALFAVTFSGAWLDGLLLMHRMMLAPSVAEPATSHIVPLNDRGTIHYITPLENTLFFYLLFPVIIVLVVIGLRIFLWDEIHTLPGQERS